MTGLRHAGATPGRRLARRASVVGYLGSWQAVRLLPERVAYALFDVFAAVAWRWRLGGVDQLEANLARVRPEATPVELRRLSREGMRSYLRYWCDVFRLPSWSRERILVGCRLEGDEPLRACLAEGRGVVAALAHMGNWDHAGAWSTLRLAPVTTVAERLEPAEVSDAFLAFRERLGMEILNLDRAGAGRGTGAGGTSSGIFPTLVRRLREGGFVPLVADRDLTSSGVEVDFFGERARMAVGPAALAEVTGAALFPVVVRYERLDAERSRVARSGWGIVAQIGAEVPRPDGGSRPGRVAAMTQACADGLAAGIARSPQDWHMLQKVFVADLDPARLRPAGLDAVEHGR
ncbi:MAG: phosphatidylinositol mannoside acyltransferase [Actinomycetes bacterium]